MHSISSTLIDNLCCVIALCCEIGVLSWWGVNSGTWGGVSCTKLVCRWRSTWGHHWGTHAPVHDAQLMYLMFSCTPCYHVLMYHMVSSLFNALMSHSASPWCDGLGLRRSAIWWTGTPPVRDLMVLDSASPWFDGVGLWKSWVWGFLMMTLQNS